MAHRVRIRDGWLVRISTMGGGFERMIVNMGELNAPVGLEDLQNLVGELRAMARQMLNAEGRNHSLTPTALAMSALRRAKIADVEWENVRWENRGHFFSALAMAMRHALIDHARRRRARGRDRLVYLAPDEDIFQDLARDADERPDRWIRLDEALDRLASADGRLSEVLHQYYFLSCSVPEIAGVTGRNERTVDRDLKRARVWLRKCMEELADG